MSPSSYMIAQPNTIPQSLRDHPQWANWHGDKVIRNSRTGRNGSSTDPNTWSTFSQALTRDPDRLVFIFTRDNGLVGLDVDGCRNPETGEIDARGRALIEQFPNIYWEISLSGTGLHGIGRGVLPAESGGKHPKGIGVFHHSRYFVMTGHALPGHETFGDFGDGLAAWYRKMFPPEPQRPASPPPSLTMDDRDILDRLINEQNGKARRLLAGDATGYPDYSSARFALANKLCFYTDVTDQIERIVRSSGLFKDADRDRDRDRKARLEATKVVTEYVGPRYDPAYHTSSHTEASAVLPGTMLKPQGIGIDASNCDDVRAELITAHARIVELEATVAARERVIERERELRKAAEARADRLAETNSKTLQILKNPDLSIGPKVTTFAVTLDLGARIANGEAPTEHGYRVPAIRIAEMTGQSEDTVARHLREVNRRGLIPKKRIREPAREVVDGGSGEITIVGARDANYIPVPDGNIINLIDRIIDYQRPELETGHGGIRHPQCPDHPEAGTIKHWTIECAECHQPLSSGETYQAPSPTESSDGNLHPDTGVENTSLSGVKLSSERIRYIARPSDRMMPSEPPLDEEPPDYWMPPNWEDDRRRVYGQVYRGDVAL